MKVQAHDGATIEVTKVLKVVIDGEEREYDPEEWGNFYTRKLDLTFASIGDSRTLATFEGRPYRRISWAVVECPSMKNGDWVRVMTDAEALYLLARDFDIDIREAEITGLCWYGSSDHFHIEYKVWDDTNSGASYYIVEGDWANPVLMKTTEACEEV